MTRIFLIVLVTNLLSVTATATYFLANRSGAEDYFGESRDKDRRIRSFFQPAAKRDLHGEQEMRPRW